MQASHRSSISNTMDEEEVGEEMGKQTNNTATMLMKETKNRELMTVKGLPAHPHLPPAGTVSQSVACAQED